MRGSSALHTETVEEVLLILPEFGVFWKNNVGVARCLNTQHVVSFGFVGSSDIIGWLKYCGIFTGIEIKTGEAVQRAQQIRFQTVLQKDNGIYILVRREGDYIEQLKRTLRNHLEKRR